MKLTYQTGVATLIQFVAVSLLSIPNAINSVASNCHSGASNCVSNLLASSVFFILTVGWFAAIWVIGYTAQERRSKAIAQLLILIEAIVALAAALNAKHHTDILSLIASLTDLVLAIWVIYLALRLMRTGNSRMVKRNRQRRPHSSTKS